MSDQGSPPTDPDSPHAAARALVALLNAEERGRKDAARMVMLIAAVITGAHLTKEFLARDDWRIGEYLNIYYGFTPAYLSENPWSWLTHMGMHGGWLHLIMNVGFFVMLGLVVARRIASGWKIAILTLLSGLGGAGLVFLSGPSNETTVIGFSGAVCGIAAAFLLSQRLDWRDALGDRRVQSSAFWFLAINVGLAFAVTQAGWIAISWEAHLGGFLAGGFAWAWLAPANDRLPPAPGHRPWG